MAASHPRETGSSPLLLSTWATVYMRNDSNKDRHGGHGLRPTFLQFAAFEPNDQEPCSVYCCWLRASLLCQNDFQHLNLTDVRILYPVHHKQAICIPQKRFLERQYCLPTLKREITTLRVGGMPCQHIRILSDALLQFIYQFGLQHKLYRGRGRLLPLATAVPRVLNTVVHWVRTGV